MSPDILPECLDLLKLLQDYGYDIIVLPIRNPPERVASLLLDMGCRISMQLAVGGNIRDVDGLEGATVIGLYAKKFLDHLHDFRALGCKCIWYGSSRNTSQWCAQSCALHGPCDFYVVKSFFHYCIMVSVLDKFNVNSDRIRIIHPPCFTCVDQPRVLAHKPGDVLHIGKLQVASNCGRDATAIWDSLNKCKSRLHVLVSGWSEEFERKCRRPSWSSIIGWYMPERVLNNIHCLVQVSGGQEDWPRFAIDAMALGVPVIAQNDGSWREMIRHGYNGFLCNNSDELSKIVDMLANDENLRMSVSDAATQCFNEELVNNSLSFTMWDSVINEDVGVRTVRGPRVSMVCEPADSSEFLEYVGLFQRQDYMDRELIIIGSFESISIPGVSVVGSSNASYIAEISSGLVLWCTKSMSNYHATALALRGGDASIGRSWLMAKETLAEFQSTPVGNVNGHLRASNKRLDIISIDNAPKSFDIFLMMCDLYDWPMALLKDLRKLGRVIIVDQGSTYAPLLEFYETCDLEVERLGRRISRRELIESEMIGKSITQKEYIVCDPDISIFGLPDNIFQLLWREMISVGAPAGLRRKSVSGSYRSKYVELKPNICDLYGQTACFPLTMYCVGHDFNTPQQSLAQYGVDHLPWSVDMLDLDDDVEFMLMRRLDGLGGVRDRYQSMKLSRSRKIRSSTVASGS
jgi:hypothetical protein